MIPESPSALCADGFPAGLGFAYVLAVVRARKAAVLTRFWQVVEQNRRVPLREVST